MHLYFLFFLIFIIMIYFKLNFYFSLKSLCFLKKNIEPKLVFKKNTIHLSKNLLNTKKISNIINIKKLYKSNYKLLMKSYFYFLTDLSKKIFSTFSLFIFLLQKDLMYYNLSYSLFFWSKPINIIFRMEWVNVNNNPTIWIRYVRLKRRFLIVWRWLSIIFKFYKCLYINYLSSFFALWKNFFLIPIKQNKLYTTKLKVYKIYLYKLF